jgi:hypothetical protein
MRTLVVVRPRMMTLLRRPTLHMVVIIEGPPLFKALDAKGGVCSQFIHVGWCVSSCFIYLSILGCGHVWTICMVWWMVNLEPF